VFLFDFACIGTSGNRVSGLRCLNGSVIAH
jgi:hypothetical protein